jgi:hypothetical protein
MTVRYCRRRNQFATNFLPNCRQVADAAQFSLSASGGLSHKIDGSGSTLEAKIAEDGLELVHQRLSLPNHGMRHRFCRFTGESIARTKASTASMSNLVPTASSTSAACCEVTASSGEVRDERESPLA